ncbi:MAG: hypothetical protein B7X55_14370 [Rhodobacterales bacterium 34-62-10]|nr:MAG: hypothetical protein B7X55_14370 [Rhodobacterales bacterium 34-62-10]
MGLRVEITGDVGELLKSERRAGARAVKQAMIATAESIKVEWRGQIVAAGLGTRLGNTIRREVYPQSRPSLNSAALIYSRAPKIVAAFEKGATIRSANGIWLAIPLPGAMKASRGGRITPDEWERRTGRALQFFYRPGRSALLIDTGEKLRGPRTFGRNFKGVSRGKRPFAPIFALVPQVTLRKRLDLYAAALRLASTLPQRIVAGWR